MKLDVTRDVVSDLWPLCQSGDASPDSQALVKEFVALDAPFAKVLEEGDRLRRVMPATRLSPDAELRLLHDAQQRARMKLLVIGGSVVLGFLFLMTALAGALFMASHHLR